MVLTPIDILIVDDDRLIRTIIADSLTCPEYHVHESTGGKGVLELIEKLRPALLILDVVMPEIDGFQICTAVRKTEWGANLPIAILSVLTDSRSIKTAFQVGATDVFPKPVNTDLLRHRVKLLLQNYPVISLQPEVPEGIFNEITDPLIVYRSDLTVEWANEQAERFYARPVSELIDNACHDICPVTSQGRCSACCVKKAVLENELQSGVKRHPDGTFWGIRVYPIKNSDGTCRKVVEIAHDITEKIKLQGDSVHARNLATIGGLAAEVAHEINNRVGGIINYSQMLINRFTDDEKLHKIAREINNDGERIASIVDSLLSFSRKTGGTYTEMTARALIEETIPLVENSLIHDGIDIATNLSDGDIVINVQKQELQQVFINLFNNSRDALNTKYPETDINKKIGVMIVTETIEANDYVVFEFLDYGPGIPMLDLDKVKQPFYSTKIGAGGTGVGLSLCHKIMKKHHGDLLLESREGEYTRVKVLVPVCQTQY